MSSAEKKRDLNDTMQESTIQEESSINRTIDESYKNDAYWALP